MPGNRRLRHWFLLILAAAFAVRLAAGIWWQQRLPAGTKFRFGDSDGYWRLAQNIVRGLPYEYGSDKPGDFPPPVRVFRTPGYPVVLAGLFCLTGDDPPVLWARCLGALLGTLAVGAVVWLTAMLFDITTALIAGAMAAVYPGAIAMSILVLAEAPFCVLMVLQVICWVAAWRCESRTRCMLFAVIAGVLAATATLVRPSWLLFTPFAVLIGLLFSGRRLRQLAIGGCMLLALVAGMMPWWIRNSQITGRFVPTTLRAGASLYDGLNPSATGASDMSFMTHFIDEQRRMDAAATKPLLSTFEYRLDRRLGDAAVAWARSHPSRVAQLAGIKLVRMWNVWPNAAEFQSWPLRLIVMLGFAPLFVLSLCGVVAFARRGWPYVLCFLPAVYFTCLHMVFVSSIRYRQPPMLLLLVLAAGVVTQFVLPRERGEQMSDDDRKG